MPNAWSEKRERQSDNVSEGLEARGKGADAAEEIAARTVNTERVRAGEGVPSGWASLHAIAASRRGLHAHSGEGGPTRDQLYAEAVKRDVKGRSTMSKAQLQRAVR